MILSGEAACLLLPLWRRLRFSELFCKTILKISSRLRHRLTNTLKIEQNTHRKNFEDAFFLGATWTHHFRALKTGTLKAEPFYTNKKNSSPALLSFFSTRWQRSASKFPNKEPSFGASVSSPCRFCRFESRKTFRGFSSGPDPGPGPPHVWRFYVSEETSTALAPRFPRPQPPLARRTEAPRPRRLRLENRETRPLKEKATRRGVRNERLRARSTGVRTAQRRRVLRVSEKNRPFPFAISHPRAKNRR